MLGPELYDKCSSGTIPKPGKDAIVSKFRLIPNPINSCANGSGIPNLRQMPWSRMHKDSWELV
jgi:hypothetical protein